MPFNAKCPGCGASDPCGCSDPYSNKTDSSDVRYTGHNLSCIDVNTCDDLSTVIQKINQAICVLQAAIVPTTSTSTSSTTLTPTTSTTTTTQLPTTTTTTSTTQAPSTTTTTSSTTSGITSTTTTSTTTVSPTTSTTTTTSPVSTTTTTTSIEPTSTSTSTSTSTTTATPTSTTTSTSTTIVCELWRNDTESEVIVTYTNCEGVVISNYPVATTEDICARPGSITPSGILTNVGTCTPSTTTSTTSSTTTSTTTIAGTSTTTSTTTIVCELWQNDTEGEVIVNYTTCEGVIETSYSVATTASICARPGTISYVSGGPLTNVGTCGGLTSTTTTSTTTEAPFLSYDLYFCGTSTPAGSRVNFIAPGQYSGGEIILGSNNECYTVVAPSTLPSNITSLGEYGTCEDCQAAIPS